MANDTNIVSPPATGADVASVPNNDPTSLRDSAPSHDAADQGGAPIYIALTFTPPSSIRPSAPSPALPPEGAFHPYPKAPEERLWCKKTRRVPDGKTGGWKYVPCGSAKCSVQCRGKWARKWAAILCRSFRVLPPTMMVRITV